MPVADFRAMRGPDENSRNYAALADELSSWWRDGIPLVSAMEANIERLDDSGLTLAASLAPNRNHMGTGFGGSLQALATLAGWGISKLSLPHDADARVVIRRSRMEFFRPVNDTLRAHCPWPDQDALQVFRATLSKRSRSPLELTINLPGDDGTAAECEALFVAIKNDR